MASVKQPSIPGLSYRILAQDETRAILQLTYICPCCHRTSSVISSVFPSDYERLELGGFCTSLTCSVCGRPSTVRFLYTMLSGKPGEDGSSA